jgi:hypothetical protein
VPLSNPDAVARKTRPRISGKRASTVGCGGNRYWSFHVLPGGFGLLRRKLLIQSVSSSTVRSAALGLVEASGTATGPYSIISPLSETECYFYRAILPRHRDCQETLCVPFFLDDGTGKLLIDPRGAQTELQPSFSEDVACDSAPDYIQHFLSRHGVRSGQAEEYCIRANDCLFVTGALQDNPAIGQRNENSVRSSQARGLAYLSPEAADLQRELAFPGLEKLPASARFSIQKQNQLNLNPPVLLRKGRAEDPFLITSSSRRCLLQGLAFYSAICIWGGPILTLSCLYILLTRLGY